MSEVHAEDAAVFMRLATSRRVTREFTREAVSESDLTYILTAGRWATRGSNSRLHRFLVVQDPALIRRVRMFSPGMLGVPVAIIVVCTDGSLAAAEQVQLDRDKTPWIDVGTAAMNMMLAAHALKLGTCPVTSFSKPAVNIVLGLPPSVEAEFIVQIGHPATHAVIAERAPSLTALGDLVRWETYRPAEPPVNMSVEKDGSDESRG